MKLNIEFANGETRIIEVETHDFGIAATKILQNRLIMTNNNELFSTNMIVKMEKINETES